MFIVILRYTKPLSEIDRSMKSHVRFLEECYRAGLFIASGRQRPRSGGVILAAAASKEQLAEVMALDPFVHSGAATFEIIEFQTSLHHPDFAPFADAGTRAVRMEG